jgi:SAM-dependent methyltransferase
MIQQAAGERIHGSVLDIGCGKVLEHVENDRTSAEEIVRILKTPKQSTSGIGGRLILFVPNRGYPFETHGFFIRGKYYFGNIPLINYFPSRIRDRLAPHVRVYSSSGLVKIFAGLPVRILERKIIFGGYDNIIAKWPRLGRGLRSVLQRLESTPLSFFGLSHFWVIERI